MSTLAWRLLALAAIAAALFGAGWRTGSHLTQAAWDRQKAQDSRTALAAQRRVIADITAQTERAQAAEALNASLQAGYSAVSDHLADSVRRYAGAARCGVHPAVADPGLRPGGPTSGPGDPEAAELAGLTRAAASACLDTYRELKSIWAAEPPGQRAVN